jgi:CheY-like chemotaxis protein
VKLRENNSYSVLVVDDEPSVREALQMILQFFKYNVVAVASGEEAIKTLEKNHFDIVITDYAMPGVNGKELSIYVKKHWPKRPVLMITAHAGMLDHSINKTVDAILTKPFMADTLGNAVAKLLHDSCPPDSSPKA